jgi:hypothetical protein
LDKNNNSQDKNNPKDDQEDDQTKDDYFLIKSRADYESLENLSKVLIIGNAITPFNIPKKDYFYLQVNDFGILIKPKEEMEINIGDKLEVYGEVHQVKAGDYLKIKDKKDIKVLKNKEEIDYFNLENCLKFDCKEKLNTAAQTEGTIIKKSFNSLVILVNDNYEIKGYYSKDLDYDNIQLTKDNLYNLKGVWQEYSNGIRLYLTKVELLETLNPEELEEKTSPSESDIKTKEKNADNKIENGLADNSTAFNINVLLKQTGEDLNSQGLIENYSNYSQKANQRENKANNKKKNKLKLIFKSLIK